MRSTCRRARLLRWSLSWDHRCGFDFQPGFRLDQACHLHHRHGREMPAHDGAVSDADVLQGREIFLLVDHIPGQPHDVLRLAVRLCEHLDDVLQRLLELAGEVARFPSSLAGPADLSGDEDELAAGGDAVGEALGACPAGRLQDLHHDCFLSLKRCTLPVSVRGSVSMNSICRGYLYGAITFFTCSWSWRTAPSPAALPGLRTTKALTIVPRSSSGQPTTPHSATAGCASSAVSTSGPAML